MTIGAAWNHGGMPLRAHTPPRWDETRTQAPDPLQALLAERFGPVGQLAAERHQPSLPHPATEPGWRETDQDRAYRRRALVRATRTDPAHPVGRRAHTPREDNL